MNKDDSKQSSSCMVKSKYFASNSMDESLSDFQEAKKSCSGPINTVKGKSSKPRKAPKRIRGQKDIRTALRSKKNELEAYSEDFDKVCKKAGIDVDSEQLQLAIALSKSLQDTASTSKDTSSQSTTSQERIGKIRTTLQEYGFKVPEIKITGNTRKAKRHRKTYKLILATDTEKNEIIANKYSHVLFQNITQCSLDYSDIDTSAIPLYNLASNASYEILKRTDTFYVSNLVEISITNGSLLRDWSKIPGRPLSPKLFEPSNMNFSEIECSQEELDIVLSGTLKSCKNIISKKSKNLSSDITCTNNVNALCEEKNVKTQGIKANNHECTLIEDNNDTQNSVETYTMQNRDRSCSPDIFDDYEPIGNVVDNSKHSTINVGRYSPKTENSVTKMNIEAVDITECVQSHVPLSSACDNQCVQIQIQSRDECAIVEQTGSQLSQTSNITKRRSNDYMEITECVATFTQPEIQNIDLTQDLNIVTKSTGKNLNCKDIDTKNIVKTNSELGTSTNPIISNKHNVIDLIVIPENTDDKIKANNETLEDLNPNRSIESMDLTQSSNSSDELPFVSLTATKDNSLDDTIIVDIDDYININKKTTHLQNEPEVHIDLTQHPERNESIHSQSFFEDYNHDHSDNTEEMRKGDSDNSGLDKSEPDKIDLTQTELLSGCNNSQCNSIHETTRGKLKRQSQSKSDSVDLTQSVEKTSDSRKLNSSQVVDEPLYVECHNSSSGSKCCKLGKVNFTLSPVENCGGEDIDLTQNSDTSDDLSQPISNKINHGTNYQTENELAMDKSSHSYSSLGKKGEVSIDYDEYLNTGANNDINSSQNTSPKSVIHEIADVNLQNNSKNNSFISNCSQNSEIFEISDKELDYSLHQSKLETAGGNFCFGGISIMDELSNLETSKKSTADVEINSFASNQIEIENFPVVSIKNRRVSRCTEISPIKHRRIRIATPQKACSSNMITVTTPMNSELMIKTDNVTPMLDYETMSTPDIHKELDKYGIKPFKRKRAIQLLTHIYNQTHPIIETYTDELASPPKRRKPNNDQPASPRKIISPRKILKSPIKNLELDTNIANNKKDVKTVKRKHTNVNKKDTKINKSQNNNINNQIAETNNTKENNHDKARESKGKGKNSTKTQKKTAPEKLDANDDLENIPSSSRAVVSLETDEAIVIKDIECKPEDWVFQKREKAKVHSCRVPLHVAFHNYVSSRRCLREAILCYEPVEIDVIHKDLVGYGHKYDPKDLLKFLDKKCITVKTTDNDARNQKR